MGRRDGRTCPICRQSITQVSTPPVARHIATHHATRKPSLPHCNACPSHCDASSIPALANFLYPCQAALSAVSSPLAKLHDSSGLPRRKVSPQPSRSP
jgi:hypothetical protein